MSSDGLVAGTDSGPHGRVRLMARIPGWLTAVAGVATVILPIFLFYSRAVSDILLSGVSVLFLFHSLLRRDWGWARETWMRLAFAFWAWVCLSSLRMGPGSSFVEALLSVRFFIFCAAMSHWILVRREIRQRLAVMCGVLAAWLVLECWQQYLTGRNMMGAPRWGDGALTGPFVKPRAGNVFVMVLFTGALPVVVRLIRGDARIAALRVGRVFGSRARVGGEAGTAALGAGAAGGAVAGLREDASGARLARSFARIGGALLLVLLVGTMVLIGQRMSNMLTAFGLILLALMLRSLRVPVLITLIGGVGLLLALPVISPPTYAKLVVKFAHQMGNFWQSPYGQIYTRAMVMVGAHPVLGVGFDGFRFFCLDAQYLHGMPWLGLQYFPPASYGCNIHPHNYYLQVATAGGLPGLVLFLGMIFCWFRIFWRALAPERDPGHAVLCVANVLTLWPLASTSTLFALPLGGWVFIIAGWALALSSNRLHEDTGFLINRSGRGES